MQAPKQQVEAWSKAKAKHDRKTKRKSKAEKELVNFEFDQGANLNTSSSNISQYTRHYIKYRPIHSSLHQISANTLVIFVVHHFDVFNRNIRANFHAQYIT